MKRLFFTAAFAAFAFSPVLAHSIHYTSPETESVARDEGNLHWTLAPKASYTKAIRNFFSKMQEGKMRKALDELHNLQEDSEKNEEKNDRKGIDTDSYLVALAPLWDLALCVAETADIPTIDVLSSKFNLTGDYWKLYSRYLEASKQHVVNTEQLLAEYGYSLASIREMLESKLIDETHAAHTEAAYDRLLDVLSDSPHETEMKTEREQLAFDIVKHTTTLAEAQRFVDKYSLNPEHVSTITTLRDRLAFEVMPATLEGCKDYLANYPRSEYVDQVKTQLYQLAFDTMCGTLDGCRDYLREYPDTPHRDKTEAIIDDFMFQELSEGKNPFDIQAYLAENPSTRYAEQLGEILLQTEPTVFLNFDVPFSQLEKYVHDYTPVDRRVRNFYNSLFACTSFFQALELKQVPKHCVTTSEDYDIVDYDADGNAVLGGVVTRIVDHYYFNKVGLMTERAQIYRNVSGEAAATQGKEVFGYTIDETSGVVSLASRELQGNQSTPGQPNRFKYTATITDGLLTMLVVSNGTATQFEYDENGVIVLQHSGTMEGGKFKKDTTTNFTDHKAVTAHSEDYETTFTHNDHGDLISVWGTSPDGSFADGYENKLGDYTPYGWVSCTKDCRGVITKITRKFE